MMVKLNFIYALVVALVVNATVVRKKIRNDVDLTLWCQICLRVHFVLVQVCDLIVCPSVSSFVVSSSVLSFAFHC